MIDETEAYTLISIAQKFGLRFNNIKVCGLKTELYYLIRKIYIDLRGGMGRIKVMTLKINVKSSVFFLVELTKSLLPLLKINQNKLKSQIRTGIFRYEKIGKLNY